MQENKGQGMRFVEGTAYDSNGNEIIVSEGHCPLIDKYGRTTFIKMKYPEEGYKLIYQPERLNEKTPSGDAKV